MGRREHSVVVDSDSWTKTTETKKVIHTNTDKKKNRRQNGERKAMGGT